MQQRKLGLADQLRVSVTGNVCNVMEAMPDGSLVMIRLLPSEALELIACLEEAVSELKARWGQDDRRAQRGTGSEAFPLFSEKDSRRPVPPGEPCGHPGCLSHISHPCEVCGRIGGERIEDVTGSKAFPSLNQEYSDRRRRTFAYCRGCKVTYWDDVPNYGSLLCPRCWEFVLVRGWVIGETGAAKETDNDDALPDERKKRLNLSDLEKIRSALLYYALRSDHKELATFLM